MSILFKSYFHDEEAAFAHLEGVLWPNGPTCPHCGGVDRISKIKANPEKRIRIGLHKCGKCKKQFTVKVGTVFEHARLPLHKMLQAVYLLCCSKKGISSHQMHRILEVQYKTAWFLSHRIREAMRDGAFARMGGAGGIFGIVEADETFIGREPGAPVRRGYAHKMRVLALVYSETGKARTMVVDDLRADTLIPILRENLAKAASIMIDDAGQYGKLGETFIEHQTVAHSQDEYVRGIVHTNTVEGYFSVFRCSVKGVYQHCGKQHLHRYLAGFDFRYNERVALGINDQIRAEKALRGIVGKRLTYRRPD